jgi:hypothetical protein
MTYVRPFHLTRSANAPIPNRAAWSADRLSRVRVRRLLGDRAFSNNAFDRSLEASMTAVFDCYYAYFSNAGIAAAADFPVYQRKRRLH